MWSEPAHNEFLKNIAGCSSTDSDKRVFKCQRHTRFYFGPDSKDWRFLRPPRPP